MADGGVILRPPIEPPTFILYSVLHCAEFGGKHLEIHERPRSA